MRSGDRSFPVSRFPFPDSAFGLRCADFAATA
jgi:hypothetical protein